MNGEQGSENDDKDRDTHREVERFTTVTQQAASEPGQTVGPDAHLRALVCRSGAGLHLDAVVDFPLCISCGFLGCMAASPLAQLTQQATFLDYF